MLGTWHGVSTLNERLLILSFLGTLGIDEVSVLGKEDNVLRRIRAPL